MGMGPAWMVSGEVYEEPASPLRAEPTMESTMATRLKPSGTRKRPASKLRRAAAEMRVPKMKMDQPMIQRTLETKMATRKKMTPR